MRLTHSTRVALAALACAAGSPGAAADPAPTTAELLTEYRSLGLRLPPPGARLVRYFTGARQGSGAGERKLYAVAFELKPGTRTEPPALLDGVRERRPGHDPEVREVEPTPAAVREFELGAEDGLVLGIQCQARGWAGLAAHLVGRSREMEGGKPVRTQLADTAWGYWAGRATAPEGDRGPVAARLRNLLRDYPHLGTPHHRELLRWLELALVPGVGKPGTVDALIDALVDYRTDAHEPGGTEPGAGYWRIAELGFDAVPTLLKHLDDDRLTRATRVGFNNFPSWPLRVGDVVGDVLEGLAAEELERGAGGKNVGGGWLRRLQGYRITPAAAAGWWEKARKEGEEAYLHARVLPPAPKEPKKDEEGSVGVDSHLLRVIAAKYPARVPGLYRTVLDRRPELGSWGLVEALTRVPGPAEGKLDLLTAAAGHKRPEHRLPALRAIRELDRGRFDALVLAELQRLPADVAVPYWQCPEAHIAGLALRSDDPRVWGAVAAAVRRASVGLRMEVLDQFGDPAEPRWRAERVRLLGAFLDDAAVRDEKSDPRFNGPGAGFGYDRIAVRDFAAVELGRLLGVAVEVKKDRTPAEWSEVRDRVRAAMRRELGRAKQPQ